MVAEVERIFHWKEAENEQYKAVFNETYNELVQAKKRFQRDLAQSKADHEDHFKRMECTINEVAANHETHNQRN